MINNNQNYPAVCKVIQTCPGLIPALDAFVIIIYQGIILSIKYRERRFVCNRWQCPRNFGYQSMNAAYV